MDNYKSNSHRSKEEAKREKINPVTKGVVKKKNRISQAIIQEDVTNIKSYALMEVIIPALKKAVADVVTDGITMLLYGDTKRPGVSTSRTNASYVSYNRYSNNRESNPGRRIGYSMDDIILPSRPDAEEVLDRMSELVDHYGVVTVADLYDLVGVSGEYTDNRYGWTSTRNMGVDRVRDGYLLKLPRAAAID